MVDIKEWYESIKEGVSFSTSLSGLAQFTWHLYSQFAQNWPERASVTIFLVKLAVSSLAPRMFRYNDAAIKLNGTGYILGLRSKELIAFEEIHHHCAYDQVADFIPQYGWIVFDVGANAGIFSILQARRGARVYAFEPNRQSHRRLVRTVAQNGLVEELRVYNYAVGSATGSGKMCVPHGWTTIGSVKPIEDSSTLDPHAIVKIISLDDVVPTLGVHHIDLLKIDTEGAEADVLEGAVRTLEMVERIVLEYHSPNLLRQVRENLVRRGFTEVLDTAQGILYMRKLDSME